MLAVIQVLLLIGMSFVFRDWLACLSLDEKAAAAAWLVGSGVGCYLLRLLLWRVSWSVSDLDVSLAVVLMALFVVGCSFSMGSYSDLHAAVGVPLGEVLSYGVWPPGASAHHDDLFAAICSMGGFAGGFFGWLLAVASGDEH